MLFKTSFRGTLVAVTAVMLLFSASTVRGSLSKAPSIIPSGALLPVFNLDIKAGSNLGSIHVHYTANFTAPAPPAFTSLPPPGCGVAGPSATCGGPSALTDAHFSGVPMGTRVDLTIPLSDDVLFFPGLGFPDPFFLLKFKFQTWKCVGGDPHQSQDIHEIILQFLASDTTCTAVYKGTIVYVSKRIGLFGLL